MFVTNSCYENSAMSALGSRGDRYFRAIELAGRFTWFIVTCSVRHDDGFEMLQTVCCSWDQDLLTLLQPQPNMSPVSVQQLIPSLEGNGRWETRQITRVWRTQSKQGKSLLVCEDTDGIQSTGLFGEAPNEHVEARTLVYEAAHGELPPPRLQT